MQNLSYGINGLNASFSVVDRLVIPWDNTRHATEIIISRRFVFEYVVCMCRSVAVWWCICGLKVVLVCLYVLWVCVEK